jgi:hypothetical protein
MKTNYLLLIQSKNISQYKLNNTLVFSTFQQKEFLITWLIIFKLDSNNNLVVKIIFKIKFKGIL